MWKWDRMCSRPVHARWLHLLSRWTAEEKKKEDVAVTPAGLKVLCTQAGLPSPEPIAEHFLPGV